MATEEINNPAIRLSKDSQSLLVEYIHNLVEEQRRFQSFRTRLENIDMDYYLYRKAKEAKNGQDVDSLTDSEAEAIIETPIAVSQVDSIVAYLTDLYLSGYPIFGTVAPATFESEGEALEAMIDSHSIKGRWGREFILSFYDAAKYNIAGLGVEWAPIPTMQVQSSITSVDNGTNLSLDSEYINRVKAYDLYNGFWDFSKSPALVAEYGEYIGYHEVVNATELKTESILLAQRGEAYNLKEAFNSSYYTGADWAWFQERPIVTNTIDPPKFTRTDWMSYAHNITPGPALESRINYSRGYLKTVAYIRIIPSIFKINVPSPNTPQIYKVILINGQWIIHIKRIHSPFNMLPILLGQLTEDGFAYQTKSIVEQAMPWQDATTELLNIRLTSARRAISDRAIYNPDVLNPADVNTKEPAPKIPMKTNLRGQLADARQAYAQIPFNDSGTAGAVSDMNSLLNLSEYLMGINSSRQGVFKKGNRTLGEYQDVQQGSDARSRVMALRFDSQVMIPLKYIIKANIFQFADSQSFVKQDSGNLVEVDMTKLREAILDFKISDGLTPKSKILPPEVITEFLQFLMSDPNLSLKYDKIKAMAHVMSLRGVPNLKQYELTPEQQQQAQQAQVQQAQQMAIAQQAGQPQQPIGA